MNLRISASNVAALIGKNPQKKPAHVMYQMLEHDMANEFQQMKQKLDRKTLDDLTKEALQSNASLFTEVHAGLDLALKNPSQVVDIIDQTEARLAETLKDSKNGSVIAEALKSVIQTERGLHNENNVLDLQENETGSLVTERNTKTRSKAFGKQTLVGRIDGLVNTDGCFRIVDAKERKRKWAKIPEQDIIQMRVQMELQDIAEAELVERFPDGTRRNTVQTRTSQDWEPIQKSLDEAVEQMHRIVANQDLLEELIQECTLEA